MTGLAMTLPQQTRLWYLHRTSMIIGLTIAAALVAMILFVSNFSTETNFPVLLLGPILAPGLETRAFSRA